MGGPSIASYWDRREADPATEEYDRDPEHERKRGGDLSRERRSGGITIGRDALDADAWIEAVTGDLREQSARDADARLALERLLA